MNGQMISYLWGFLENLLKEHQASSCLEILDSVGQRLLFLTCGDILPVSLSLSGRKAYTSYVFRMPSEALLLVSPILGTSRFWTPPTASFPVVTSTSRAIAAPLPFS